MAPRLDLLKLKAVYDPSVDELIKLLGKDMTPEVQSIVYQEMNLLTQSALDAFRSNVPVRTRQLRDQHLNKSLKASIKTLGASSSVYVLGARHTATYGRPKPISSELAEILDKGVHELTGLPMKRRKNAIPSTFSTLVSYLSPQAGAPTANWIDNAISAFEQVLNSG